MLIFINSGVEGVVNSIISFLAELHLIRGGLGVAEELTQHLEV